MPTNRFQFSDDFVLNNGNVGIGSSVPQEKLDVVDGSVRGEHLKVTGVSSFTTYEGFLNSNQNITESISLTAGTSGSLSGEIIIGTGVTVTVQPIGLGTTTVGVGTIGTITNTISTTNRVVSGQGSIDSLKVYNTFTVPVGGTADRPPKPTPGQLFFNRDFATMEFWDGDRWRQVDNTTQRGRGVWAGGQNPTRFTTIDYVNIHSTGNAINFGDLITAREFAGGQPSSSIRGLFGGGELPGGTYSNVIEYITTASQGNAISFGTLSETRKAGAAFSSSTRGIWASGRTPTSVNTIDYVEISTLGNALDFGDSIIAGPWRCGFSSPTRGVFAGGGPFPTTFSIIEFVTMSSKGNSVYFGDLVEKKQSLASFSNSLRGFIGGGFNAASTNTDTIEYVTIATLGNGQDFGNLSTTRRTMSGSATQTRGVFGAGETPFLNIIEYITLSTAGNAQDFGDLTIARASCGSCSDSHGGLGGF